MPWGMLKTDTMRAILKDLGLATYTERREEMVQRLQQVEKDGRESLSNLKGAADLVQGTSTLESTSSEARAQPVPVSAREGSYTKTASQFSRGLYCPRHPNHAGRCLLAW